MQTVTDHRTLYGHRPPQAVYPQGAVCVFMCQKIPQHSCVPMLDFLLAQPESCRQRCWTIWNYDQPFMLLRCALSFDGKLPYIVKR
jgi:hypothetical protein